MKVQAAGLAVVVLAMALVPGCQCTQQMVKSFTSQTAGLHRRTQLYTAQGVLVGSWTSTTVIDDDSEVTTLFDSTGRRVLIKQGIGMVVSQEIP